MRIGVVSDSHGDRNALLKAVKVAGPIDLWLHAGDYSQDAEALAATGVSVFAVAGNCDGASAAKPDEFTSAANKNIWLTHGHRYHVKNGLQELTWWARHYEVDIAVYGHTHIPEIISTDQLLIVNPGSIARPRWAYPTFAIISILNQAATAEIIEVKIR